MSRFLEGLNPKQQEAVMAIDGVIQVNAVAGSGKCITGDTLIFTDKGMIPISEVPSYFDDNISIVKSIDLNSLSIVEDTTSHWYDLGVSDTIKIETSQGYTIEGTPEHPIIVMDNGNLIFKKLEDISTNDIVAINLDNNLWGKDTSISPKLSHFIGLLLGDGYICSSDGKISFAKVDEEFSDKYKLLVKDLFGEHIEVKTYRHPTKNSVSHEFYSIDIKRFLQEEIGLDMVGANNKSIPNSIMCSCKETVRGVLQGIFDTDGGVNPARGNIEYSTNSKKLAHQIQICLLNFGINCRLKNRPNKYGNHYYIYIGGSALRTFHQEIGFNFAVDKSIKLQKICDKPVNDNVRLIPQQEERLSRLLQILKGKPYMRGNSRMITPQGTVQYMDYYKGRKNLTVDTTNKILNTIDFSNGDIQYLKLLSGMLLDPISSIEKGSHRVYDFTVPNTHSFVSNGIISHNTRVLTHRLAYMIEKGIKPSNIMCTTFTKKATEEMLERMEKLIPKMTLAQVTIGTSHSIGYRILAKEYAAMNHRLAPAFRGREGVLMNSKLRIFAEDIKKSMLNDITIPMSVKKELNDLPIPYFLKQIGLAKNENITADEIEQHMEDTSARSECIVEFYKRYEAKKWNERKIDPDDMLLLLVRLLQSDRKILDKYRKIYKYLMIDEAQDNNGLQYEMFKLLAFPENNIFVVGDDDQCQPPNELVLTPNGYKKISELDPVVDTVVAYDQRASCINGLRKGHKFQVAKRQYEGDMYTLNINNTEVQCTDNHIWLCKWSDEAKESAYAVYMMNKGNNWRVGWCKLFKRDGDGWNNHFGIRCRNQKADRGYLLKIVDSPAEASLWENIIAANYGLQLAPFVEPANTQYYTQDNLDFIFSNTVNQMDKALICLREFNKNVDYPMYDKSKMYERQGGKSIGEYRTCNLFPEYLEVPVQTVGKEVCWKSIDSIDISPYTGEVYSLQVDKYETYVTNNGIVTHNCMYSFRGARPDQFINLRQIYSGVQTVALEDNYRSHPAVLSLANKLIVNNKVRLPKSLQAHKEDDGDDNTFFSLYKDEDVEASEVCKEIQALLQEEVKPKDISILYRTNAQSRALEEGMIMSDIPYVIHGGVSFYDRKEVKDVLSYLKLLKDPTDDEAFVRVINVPSRYLGKMFLQKVLADGRSCLEVIRDSSFQNGLKPYEKRGVSSFLEVIDGMSDLLNKGEFLSEVIDYLLNDGGYADYLVEMSDDEADDDRLENVGTLKYVIDKKDDLSKFLEYVKDMTTGAKIDINGVQLMTIHKSKGLEFPNVFIVGNNEGLLPHFKSIETATKTGEDTAIEEERRLLYVAITRAESKVYLSSTKEYAGKPVKVSRFMGEIEKYKSNTSKFNTTPTPVGKHSSSRLNFGAIKKEYYKKID